MKKFKDGRYYDTQFLIAKYPRATEDEQQWFAERVSEYISRGTTLKDARQQAYLEVMD